MEITNYFFIGEDYYGKIISHFSNGSLDFSGFRKETERFHDNAKRILYRRQNLNLDTFRRYHEELTIFEGKSRTEFEERLEETMKKLTEETRNAR